LIARRFITAADRFVMCLTWTLVSLVRLLLLPLHLVSFTLFRGCEEVITMTTEMQAATLARLKAE